MQRIARTSLLALPICFLLGCEPMELTVGDENAPQDQTGKAGKAGTDDDGTANGSSKASGSEPEKGGQSSKPQPSGSELFACQNGAEIDTSLVCNGKTECGDNSDEYNCPFTCDNGSKVAQDLLCNGKDECGDNSDEAGCPPSP